MSVPAGVRRRWGLTDGGRVTVIDLRLGQTFGDTTVSWAAGTSSM